jgi:ATPase involved in DNA repair
MHIKLVELENIKSHADAKFEFSRGSTAITGENGAGKTTIIEAIAWTLFDLLDYKKDDFVRRGAKKGVARVTFESGLDEREYTAVRDTGTVYYIYDPQLKMRIAEKKEEVTRFLWQHLGVEPGTDLESLFKHAIGVPQGTFSAIFLATAAERKKTFDTLLKVEEYRRGAEELLKTQRFIENQIGAVRERVARSEGELSRLDLLETEHKGAVSTVATYTEELKSAERAAAENEKAVKSYDELAAVFDKSRAEYETLRSEVVRSELIAKQKASELEQSKEASAKIGAVRSDAERHIASLGRISELERERTARDRVRTDLQRVESAENSVRSDEKLIRSRLAEIETAHSEVTLLRSKAEEQASLEKSLDEARSRFAVARTAAKQVAVLDDKLANLRIAFTQNKQAQADATAKAVEAGRVDELQTRESEIVTELARLRAELDRDERFKNEIQNGLCPILSERCLNLKEGQTLEGFISSQFGELRAKISGFEREHAATSAALRASREAAKTSALIGVYEERAREIEAEGKRLKAEREEAAKATEDETALGVELTALESKLAGLDNPKGRIVIYERQIASEAEIRGKLSEIEKNLERIESDRRIFVEQAEAYKDLDKHWQTATEEREATAEAHRVFLTFETAAGLLAGRQREFDLAARELAEGIEKLDVAQTAFENASSAYDSERHNTAKAGLQAAQRTLAETSVRLENATRRQNEFAAELQRLTEIRASLQDEFRERERLEGVYEATVFIRDTLKEAAPLVARNYVYHVSAEANQMFREISGNAERSLKWGEDYGIVLEEGGYERPFQSLSGGEQMAAALSVRLALLKQLSDIRIAFFDEPTTNMDAERRENLAMQIGQIRHFDQLFVISHDDTFEGYMDNELGLDGK